MRKIKSSLFKKLFVIFFGAGISVILVWILSFHFLGERPHKKRFLGNVKSYALLMIEKKENGEDLSSFLKRSNLKLEIVQKSEIKQIKLKKYPHVKLRSIGEGFRLNRNPRFFVLTYTKGEKVYIFSSTGSSNLENNFLPILSGLSLSLLILFLTWVLIQKLFKPIKDIQEASFLFGQGNLTHDIQIHGNTELDDLAHSINHMKENIKEMLESKRSLLLAIGHEIKTPLSRMRIAAEMMEDIDSKNIMIQEIEEIDLILSTLLESERLKEHKAIKLESTDLSLLINEVNDERIEVKLEQNLKNCLCDKARIKLAITNLLDNALKYSQGKVELKIYGDDNFIHFQITDVGPGISPEHLEHITEAFYRPDTHRSKEKGGVGLGLFLVKEIVRSHGGVLNFENRHPGLKVSFSIKRLD